MKPIILTGGPGIGKTKLLEELARRGYETVEEGARQVKKIEQDKHDVDSDYKPILPQFFPQQFQHKVFAYQLQLEKQLANTNGNTVFMDRSLVDILGFSRYFGVHAPTAIVPAVKQAEYGGVLLLDPLPASIYQNDSERIETHDESKIIHEMIADCYREFNFEITVVPYFALDSIEKSVGKRADFVEELL